MVSRLDGTTSRNVAKITNISVSENYTLSRENGYEIIKIGSSSKTIIGNHTYTIKYTYNIGKDPLKNADELYFNLIGDGWDTTLSNVTFKITMPKEFDKSLLGFSSGATGSITSSNVTYNVEGNVIKGSLNDMLYSGEGLTVRLTLPEGYFVGASQGIDFYSIAVIVICLIFVLIADRLWTKYGKDDVVVETVEFYPPEGYNSAEVGFLYEGIADTPAIISLLIYLANKGYLKIEEIEEQGIFKKTKTFKITKLKEYDGNDKNERMFFNGLFKKRHRVDMEKVRQIIKEAKENGEKLSISDAVELSNDDYGTTSVTATDLYDNFYTTLNRISSSLNSRANKKKIFESSASGKGKWLIMMIIAIFTLITVKPVADYYGLEVMPFAILFPGIGFAVLFGMLFAKTQVIVKIFTTIWGLGFGGIPWFLIVWPSIDGNTMYIATYIIGTICAIVLMLFVRIMPKRTPFGNKMLGKLRGFKRFLETAEKDQLETLVEENPEYFYNILPYTYALGVSDVWIKQFETIALQAPKWYDSTDAFNMNSFGTFMTRTMTSASTAMSSSPSSGSGGSSGGGSSGGGSGGGGGGSW